MNLATFTLLALVLGNPAPAARYRISVGPVESDLAATVLAADLPDPGEARSAAVLLDGKEVPAQLERSQKGARVWFQGGDLKKGERREWMLELRPVPRTGEPRMSLEKGAEGRIQVKAAGKPFTALIPDPGAQKPYLYPVLLDGLHMTRRWPSEEAPDEDHDHPHQRSFWFTHGDVNKVDFWSVGPKAGKTVQKEVRSAAGGEVFASIATTGEWIAPGGKKLLEDEREYRFYDLGAAGRFIDFTIALKPADEPVVFGDTKEGTFGIRLAESMKERRGGLIVNSRGQEGMDEAWGKPAEWVDYTGKVEGRTVGVAIFDDPSSFRHPTTWHVRDYGLFAANPFGLHDFTKGKAEGSYRLDLGQTVRFRYRVFLHPGSTEEARVAAAYRAYANPPEVKVEPQG